MDITLHMAAVKFDGDKSAIRIDREPAAVCFVTGRLTDDCLKVSWGTQLQFEAEISLPDATIIKQSGQKATQLQVRFEVAANATNALLRFGDLVGVPLNLSGDDLAVEIDMAPVAAPIGGDGGYLEQAGRRLAISGIHRDRSELESNILIDLLVSSADIQPGLAAVLSLTSVDGDTCFGSSQSRACLSASFGSGPEIQPILWFSDMDGQATATTWVDVRTPRGKGWPVTVGFEVPNVVDSATLKFGDHVFSITLNGMAGQVPSYDYKEHYSQLQPGATMYEVNNKKVVMEAVATDVTTGDMVIDFKASNQSEATDFTPQLRISGGRVAESGLMFDGRGSSWAPVETHIKGPTVPPGGSGSMIARIPRRDLDSWGETPYSLEFRDRPDVAIVDITVTDMQVLHDSGRSQVGYLPFDRMEDERHWYIGGVLWSIPLHSFPDVRPVVNDGMVYIQGAMRSGEGDSFEIGLFAIDGATGQIHWTVATHSSLVEPPLVTSELVLAQLWFKTDSGGDKSLLRAFDKVTGIQTWEYEDVRDVQAGIAYPDLIYGLTNERSVVAINSTSGNRSWGPAESRKRTLS